MKCLLVLKQNIINQFLRKQVAKIFGKLERQRREFGVASAEFL